MENNLNNLPPFYSGQKIVCINNEGWFSFGNEDEPSYGPKYNDIVTCINCYISPHDGNWYVNLVGHSNLNIDNGQDGYDCVDFVPLQEKRVSINKAI